MIIFRFLVGLGVVLKGLSIAIWYLSLWCLCAAIWPLIMIYHFGETHYGRPGVYNFDSYGQTDTHFFFNSSTVIGALTYLPTIGTIWG